MISFGPGDVLFGKLRPYLAKSWRADRIGRCSSELIVMRPKATTDARWLGYLAQSDKMIEWSTETSEGVKMPRTSWEKLRQLEVELPTLGAQRVIADYLDAETARIDELLRSRLSMARLVEEREQAHLAYLLGDWRTMPMSTLRQSRTRLVTGPFGTQLAASEYATGGTPVINPTHIADGRIDPDPDVAVPLAVAVRLARHRLERGDIVMGRKGDVGRAAVIGPREYGWICGSDSIAIRTDPQRVLPDYLALVMSMGYYRQQLEARSTGAMVANVNESILMDFRVPAVPPERQREIIAAGHRIRRLRRRAVAAIEGQAALLIERRQALITAAVTGQLEIPGVAA